MKETVNNYRTESDRLQFVRDNIGKLTGDDIKLLISTMKCMVVFGDAFTKEFEEIDHSLPEMIKVVAKWEKKLDSEVSGSVNSVRV